MPNSADKYDTLSLVICLELDDGTGHGSDNVVAITVALMTIAGADRSRIVGVRVAGTDKRYARHTTIGNPFATLAR